MTRRIRVPGRFGLLLTFLFATLGSLLAQTNSGELTGRVTDQSDAVVPDAQVQVTSLDTGDIRKTSSNKEGYFVVTFLTPGTYEVSAVAQGFRKTVQSGIRLVAGQRLSVVITMEVGAVADSVTVSATAQQVDTEDAKVRHVIDGSQAQELPLNGRILSHLLQLIPGVAVQADLGVTDIAATLTNYSVNGARGVYNLATVDGGYNLDSGSMGSQTNQVSPDWVGEVSVVTSGYSAEYGRNSGVQINYSTRSGTKDFHGSLYEFFRNDKMDARNFFGTTKDKLRFNNFGWALGGPITIPGKFNSSRQKLFFFAGEEFKRRAQNQLQRATTPTSDERSGIITSTATLLYPSNFPVIALRGQPITDPSRATPSNPTGRNIVPKQYITPNGQAIMNIYQSMLGFAGQYIDTPTPNNTTFQLPNPDRRREDIAKVDYQLNQNQRLSFSMLYGTGSNETDFVNGPYPTHGFIRRNKARTGRIVWSDVLSPSSVNRVTAQVNYLNIRWPALGARDKADQYGLSIKELFGNQIQTDGIPAIAIQGYSSISGSADAWQAPTADFSVMDDFNHLHGSHNFKAGVLVIRNRKNEADNTTSRLLMGNVSFAPAGNPVSTGNALADTLLGNFASWREAENLVFLQVRYSEYEAYVADTWKALPNLSIDYGLRFAYHLPNHFAENNTANFDPAYWDPAQAPRVIPSGPGAGSLQAGVGNRYNGLIIPGTQFYNNFDTRFAEANDPAVVAMFRPNVPAGIAKNYFVATPRLGVSWDPTGSGRVALRSGAGFFMDVLRSGMFESLGPNPPFGNITEVDYGSLADPASGTAAAKFPLALSGMRPDFRPPLTFKANLGVQTRIPSGAILDVNLVTSQTRHNIRRVDINQVSPATQVANPGININALRPYQGYTSILMYESSSSSNYNGLQVGLNRRYAKGFTYGVAYTYSKALDDGSTDGTQAENIYDFHSEKSHSDFDRNHVLVINYIYEMPFWRNGKRFYEKALGGWSLSGINQFQSGPWLTPNISTATGARRPDRVGPPQYLDPRNIVTLVGGDGQPRAGNFYFDPGPGGMFVAPPNDRYGNSAPRIIRGPGRNNWNVSLMKDFRVRREATKLTFRADAFNIFNHAQFNNPSVSASSRDFGTISSAAPGRNLQMSLKLVF
jgi:hypothetical protein